MNTEEKKPPHEKKFTIKINTRTLYVTRKSDLCYTG